MRSLPGVLLLLALALPGAAQAPVSPRVAQVSPEEHAALSAAVQALFVSAEALPGYHLSRVAVVDPGARARLDEVSGQDARILAAMGASPQVRDRFAGLLPQAAQLGRPLDLSVPSVFSPPLRGSLEAYYEALERKHPGFGARLTVSRVAMEKEGPQALAWVRAERAPGGAAEVWVLLHCTTDGWSVRSWRTRPAD